MKTILRKLALTLTLFAFIAGGVLVVSPAAYAADITVTPPVYTAPAACLVGAVSAPNTPQYTWAASGPNGARMYTATLVDPVGDSFNGQNIFGPYNLVASPAYPDPACQPYFEVVNGATCGNIKITFHNLSNWNWSPDYHYTGDGVIPQDYGSGPTWKNVFVQRGTTRVIWDYTFPEDYNGGAVDVSYQSLLGPVTQIRVASQTISVITDCATPPVLNPVTVTAPAYTAGNACLSGNVIAPATAQYTWAESGPDNARLYNASLVDPINDVFNGQNIFGPYDVTAPIGELDSDCQTYFTVVTSTCGYVEVTFHNPSNFNREPDYRFEGDGVVAVDYNGVPTYSRVSVPRGTSAVIFSHNFAEDENGGAVDVSYQSVVGNEAFLDLTSTTISVDTDCVTPPLLNPVTVVEPDFNAGDKCLDGSASATSTTQYTWAESGPDSARFYTASLVDPINDVFNGQNVFGPYNVTAPINFLDPACKPYFEVYTAPGGVVKITFHNPSNWDWSADFHFDGDGVAPVDYNGVPTYTRAFVPRGTSDVIFDYTFPAGYNGGSVSISFQSIIGPESLIEVPEVTIELSTLALPDAVGPDQNKAPTGQLARTGVTLERETGVAGFALLALIGGGVLIFARRRMVSKLNAG